MNEVIDEVEKALRRCGHSLDELSLADAKLAVCQQPHDGLFIA